MVKNFIPKKGDIVFVSFDPQSGKEQKGFRPAIVLSEEKYNQSIGLCLVCPITSKIKGYPFEILLPDNLKTAGAVLADHIRNIDFRSRHIKFVEHSGVSLANEVVNVIMTVSGN